MIDEKKYSTYTLLINQVFTVLDKWLSTRQWLAKVVVTCLFLSFVTMIIGSPGLLRSYAEFLRGSQHGNEFDAFATVKAQATTFYKDLGLSHFTNSRYESTGHLHKMRFRLFLPFLVATVGIKHVGITIWIIQSLFVIVFLFILVLVIQQLLHDRSSTFLFAAAFSFLYPVRSAWLDITAYGDFFSYLFLLIAIYTANPWFIFSTLQLAFWCDERSVLNAGFVLMWYVFATVYALGYYKITQQQVAVLLSVLGYFLVRLLISITNRYAFVDNQYWAEFTSTYYENIKLIGFRVWSGFLNMWSLVLVAIFLLGAQKKYGLLGLLLSALLFSINCSFIVYDTNRALSYSYIAIFISLSVIARNTSKTELRYLLLFILISLLFCPLPNRLQFPGGYKIM